MTRPQIVIENPILNARFAAPAPHFRMPDAGGDGVLQVYDVAAE